MATRTQIYPITRDPFKHQLEAVNLGLRDKALAIFFEPRLGKTLAALLIAALRFQRGEVKMMLVAVKKVFMDVWEDEAKDLLIPYEVIRISGKKTKRFQLLGTVRTRTVEQNQLTIVLVNYEMIWRIRDELLHLGFDIFVLDESRRIAGHDSNQAKACHTLSDNIEFKLALTGNPFAESPIDGWSQYRCLDPSVFGKDYQSFFKKYARTIDMPVKTPYGTRTVEKVVGTKNLEQFTKLAQSKAIVRSQAECLDLPPMTTRPIWVVLEPEARRQHDAFGTKDAEESLSLLRIARQTQITGGFAKVGKDFVQISTAKLDALQDLIDDHPSSWKFVIFTQYHHELDAIMERMRKMKRTANEISGRVSDAQNSIRIKNFQQYARFTDLVVQCEKGALGLDFTASNTEVFYTPSVKYEMYYQATQRVQGPKQKRPTISIFQLRVKDSADDDMYEALNSKRDVEQHILRRHRRI